MFAYIHFYKPRIARKACCNGDNWVKTLETDSIKYHFSYIWGFRKDFVNFHVRGLFKNYVYRFFANFDSLPPG